MNKNSCRVALAILALALPASTMAGTIVSETLTGTFNSGTFDTGNYFGQGAGANLSGQTVTVSVSYDVTSLLAHAGQSGAPLCADTTWGFASNDANGCTSNSYGDVGYWSASGDESWTSIHPTSPSTVGVSYTVGGTTIAINNDSTVDPNRQSDIDLGGSGTSTGFQYNTYDHNRESGSYGNGNNFRLFLDSSAYTFATGVVQSPSLMDAFAASVSSGSVWLNDGTNGFEVLQFSNVTSASAATPEPGSILLFGTGLAGLVAVVRRKRA